MKLKGGEDLREGLRDEVPYAPLRTILLSTSPTIQFENHVSRPNRER